MSEPQPVRVLCMEDDEGLARLLQKRLGNCGYLTDLAPDGNEGLNMYDSGPYDVLVLDHHMPGKNGLEVIQTLASRGKLPPTIMITGAGSETVAVQALKLGAVDYMIKDGKGRYLDLIPSVIEQALARERLLREKQWAEQALRDSEAKFKQLAENIQEVFWLRAGERVIYVSPAYEQIWGRKCESLYEDPASFLETVVPEDRERVIDIFASEAQTTTEYRIVRADGSIRWIHSRAFPIKDEEGNIERRAGIDEDVTDAKRAQEILIQSERLKAIGALATGVAHNFNNLLQVIMGAAHVAAKELDTGDLWEARQHVDRIREISKLGADTVKRLQSFARLRSDFGPAEGELLDLSHIVRQAIDMSRIWWKGITERDGVGFKLVSEIQGECRVSGRENELFEVTINLLKNAVEAMPSGGEIKVETFIEDEQVVLRVADTGVGLSAEDLGKIFEPFYTTKGFNSAGMGLSSSLGIIRAHNGTISVDHGRQSGSVFTVKLPLAGRTKEPETVGAVEPSAIKARILVIDDVQPVVTMIEAGLAALGQRVFAALSGKQGVRIFRQELPDVVICDLGMPEMNGWQVSREVAAICREMGIPKKPLVLLTGWGGQEEQKDKISEYEVDRVVEKPVDLSKLLDIVAELMRKPVE